MSDKSDEIFLFSSNQYKLNFLIFNKLNDHYQSKHLRKVNEIIYQIINILFINQNKKYNCYIVFIFQYIFIYQGFCK